MKNPPPKNIPNHMKNNHGICSFLEGEIRYKDKNCARYC